ncbi:MAG TPA: riboflavin synthase [bacterium]|nr:riboflavin synthase [bacterium]HPP86394.1 riboflavin synthase [bacterium]
MFTGIIEEIGIIKRIERNVNGLKLSTQCSKIIGDLKNGDSVSVNGVCLTVSKITADIVHFDVMAETLKKTTLKKIKTEDKVNLERAMLLNSRLDGHFVQGHIDCIAKIIAKKKISDTIYLEIKCPENFSMYLAPRGSVAINGVSLTIAKKNNNIFTVALVKFTQDHCNLAEFSVNSEVNIEFDIIGKYLYEFYKKKDNIRR